MNRIDFAATFRELMANNTIDPQLSYHLAIAGVLLLLWTLARFAWSRSRGGSNARSPKDLVWTLLIGCAMVAPMTVIPIVLDLVDWVANGALQMGHSVTKHR